LDKNKIVSTEQPNINENVANLTSQPADPNVNDTAKGSDKRIKVVGNSWKRQLLFPKDTSKKEDTDNFSGQYLPSGISRLSSMISAATGIEPIVEHIPKESKNQYVAIGRLEKYKGDKSFLDDFRKLLDDQVQSSQELFEEQQTLLKKCQAPYRIKEELGKGKFSDDDSDDDSDKPSKEKSGDKADGEGDSKQDSTQKCDFWVVYEDHGYIDDNDLKNLDEEWKKVKEEIISHSKWILWYPRHFGNSRSEDKDSEDEGNGFINCLKKDNEIKKKTIVFLRADHLTKYMGMQSVSPRR
jgi:hypothetical protein